MNAAAARQDISGNALEYAIAMQTACIAGVPLADDSISQKARADFMRQPVAERAQLTNAAIKGVLHFLAMESPLPLKENSEVRMQPDSAGKTGDPRDLVLTLQKGALGLSVKRNNETMKNPRAQRANPDFCKMWGLSGAVSAEYRRATELAFKELDAAIRGGARKWSEIARLREKVYAPILRAFAREFELAAASPENCGNFVRYMIGAPDYYKLTARLNQSVVVQGFNFGGALSCAKISHPRRLLSAVPISDTTLALSFNGGWTFSMRIHNASAKLENSLKWDVKLTGHPANLYSHAILL